MKLAVQSARSRGDSLRDVIKNHVMRQFGAPKGRARATR